MGKGDEKGHRKGKGSGSSSSQVAQKQLWEINEVIINENYTLAQTDDNVLYYSLCTSREDLPASFWYSDWVEAMERRAEAEKQVESSGRNAQQSRGRTGGQQLLSQQIADNPSMSLVISSGQVSQNMRKGKKGK